MRFHVLGPMLGRVDGRELKLGGPKQRLVLALLLSAHGDTVSTALLTGGLWGDDPPKTARKTLQGYVHHLRNEIGDRLRTDGAGYSLDLAADDVDERRFSTMVGQARAALESDPRSASELLTEALALWRGTAYADLDGELALEPEIIRLGELRMLALGDRIEADLALGRHETLIGELESLTADYPLRERFRAQQMLALYRSGRHGEALRAFSRARAHLIDEMGIEPSVQLTSLEERILARDPDLDVTVVDRSGPTRAIGGYELRDLVSSDATSSLYRGYQRSVGREVAIRVIGPERANAAAFMARYQADTSRIAAIDHPHVVYVQDTWREPDCVYQVMQWIDGQRLASELADGGYPIDEAIAVLGDVADALEATHGAGVVHGAVDADAVLVSRSGDAYLTDFAVGREPGTAADDVRAFARLAHRVAFGVDPLETVMGPEVCGAEGHDPELVALFDDALGEHTTHSPAELVAELGRILRVDVVPSASPERDDARPRSDVRNPYKGLRAFEVGDAADFHGRDAAVRRLVEHLTEHQLVAVVGPSGSGKSSLVKAGLAARLTAGERPVLVTEMYPGANPFDELERALRRIAVGPCRISDELVGDGNGLRRVAEAVLPSSCRAVLVIDQFEELFSLVDSEPVRTLFLENLTSLATTPGARLRVVLTIRADFFDRPLRYPEFGALVEAGLITLSLPDEAGLAAAIEQPASAMGVRVEAAVTDEIVREVRGQSGALPLLQYTMTELFERRASDVITRSSYLAAGGVLGSLASRADELYLELSKPAQHAIQQALMRLVSVDEGADDVRRRVRRAELFALDVDRMGLEAGLAAFIGNRLLTVDADPISRAPTVEVAHEALLREWDRLREWIDERRGDLLAQRRLGAALREWNEAGHDDGYLLRGGRLAQFDRWSQTTPLVLSSAEREFLDASIEHDVALARRAGRRRRLVMATLLVGALAASALAVFALVQRSAARERARDAETARLANEAGFVSDWNRQLALLMAVEAYEREPGLEGVSALQRVLVDAGPFLGVVGAPQPYDDVAWVAAGLLLAHGPGGLELIEIETGLRTAVDVETRRILAASPSGVVAVSGPLGDLTLADLPAGRVAGVPAAAGATAAAISSDGSTLFVGYADGRLESIDGGTGRATATTIANPPRSVTDLALSEGVLLSSSTERVAGIDQVVVDASGELVLTVGGPVLRVWNTADLTPAGPEIVHATGADELNLLVRSPLAAWFDPADPGVVVGVDQEYAVEWDVESGRSGTMIELAGRAPVDAAPSAVGDLLTLDGGGLVTGALDFDSHRVQTSAFAIDPAGRRLAMASDSGIVLAALDGDRLLASAAPIGNSLQPSISSDGSMLAPGLASDGLVELATGATVPFDVNVEIAEVAGSASTFRFAPAGDRDVLVWESPFVEVANAYDPESGAFVDNVWGSPSPAWADGGRIVARSIPSGGTVIERNHEVVFDHPSALRSADFDDTAERALVTFVDRTPGGDASAQVGGIVPTSGVFVDLSAGTSTPLPTMPGGLFSAAFGTDDDIILMGGRGAVWIVDARSLQVDRELQNADVAVDLRARPPVVGPDGAYFFSAADGRARLWDLESGRQIGRAFESDEGGRPYAVAGETVLRLVTPSDGNALVWELDTSRWVEIACRAAGRNMTRVEWDRYGPADIDYRPTCERYGLEQGDG